MVTAWRHIHGSERPAADASGTLERELITSTADAVRQAAADKSPSTWWRLSALRTRGRDLVRRVLGASIVHARRTVTDAARAGQTAAEHELRQRHLPVTMPRAAEQVAENARKEITDTIANTTQHVMTSADVMYRRAFMAVQAQPAASQAARLRMAQRVLDDLADNGVTGFRDKAGRNWGLPSYIEMATRAVAFNAQIDGHVATLTAHNQDLLVISTAVACCPVCAPWEGQVVSASGLDPSRPSLADARTAGWAHPNCRCSIQHYLPGDPIPDVVEPPSPAQYAATQQLRALERRVRAAKRVRAAALTPDAARRANTRIRAYQTQIRQHIATTGARRIRRREQIGRAL